MQSRSQESYTSVMTSVIWMTWTESSQRSGIRTMALLACPDKQRLKSSVSFDKDSSSPTASNHISCQRTNSNGHPRDEWIFCMVCHQCNRCIHAEWMFHRYHQRELTEEEIELLPQHKVLQITGYSEVKYSRERWLCTRTWSISQQSKYYL